MGHNPRYGAWPPSAWRRRAETVAALRREGWPVHAVCLSCHLHMKVDLARIERARGGEFVLWGRTGRCCRLRCDGQAMFFVSPPRANGSVAML
jgi:hypothetical protein